MKKYDQYKNSGVEWLGEIPEHWEVKKMKFIGNIYAGINGKKGDDFSKEYSDGIKSFIPFTNICNNFKIDDNQYQYVKIDENENQNRVHKNDILFLMSSETLEDIAKNSIYLGDNIELYLNSFCKGFRILKQNVNAEFVNYLFLSKTYRNYFSLVGRGFTRINLKQEFINDAYALLPKIEEQTTIANFLDDKTNKIDQAIAIKQKQIELLKERRQILIHKAVTRGLDDSVKLKDSGVEWIGEIPEHWEVKRLKYFINIQGGFAFNSSNFKNEGVQIIKIANTYMNELCLDRQPTFIEKSFLKTHNEWIVSKGDILMSLTGTLGKKDYGFAILIEDNEQYLLNQRVAKITMKKGFEPDYILDILRSEMYLNQLYMLPSGTKQANLSNDNVINIKVAFPSNQVERVTILEYVKITTTKIANAISLKEQEIERLKEYKVSLIDGVVTGKIKVS